jgi:hypothetical protein
MNHRVGRRKHRSEQRRGQKKPIDSEPARSLQPSSHDRTQPRGESGTQVKNTLHLITADDNDRASRSTYQCSLGLDAPVEGV